MEAATFEKSSRQCNTLNFPTNSQNKFTYFHLGCHASI
jgi:hypothetical protein